MFGLMDMVRMGELRHETRRAERKEEDRKMQDDHPRH
jgi:hypothetical protein